MFVVVLVGVLVGVCVGVIVGVGVGSTGNTSITGQIHPNVVYELTVNPVTHSPGCKTGFKLKL